MIDKTSASFMQSLCCGEVREDIVFPYPKIKQCEKDILSFMFESFDSFLKTHEKDFIEWDKAGEMPESFIEELKQFGMFGIIVPEKFDGIGLGSASYSRAIQEVAKYDGSVAVTIGAHSSIGMRGLLMFGTESQKKKYLPRLATGELIAAFCLTESCAGSDAAALKTRAVRSGNHWVLNGEKLWITNGGFANFFTVLAKTQGDDGKDHVTAFIVTRDMGGVTSGPHENKMGICASSTTTVNFDNVHVPEENVMGEVGQGFKVAMKILNGGRTGLSGGAVGSMKKLIKLIVLQAKERKQFGKPIASFGLIKQKISDMVVRCYVSESVVNMLAGLIDQGYQDYAIEAAISKVLSSEALWDSSDDALQIAGGNGYMKEFPYERIMRDSRINRIFEGTNDILRLMIALTGMKSAGDSLKEVPKALRGILTNPAKNFGVLSKFAIKQVSLHVPVRLSSNSFEKISPEIRGQAEVFEDCARRFEMASASVLRKYGKHVVDKQQVVQRLADIMVDLYALVCTLSRVDARIKAVGFNKSKQEANILKIFAGQMKNRVENNCRSINSNSDYVEESLSDYVCDAECYEWDNI